MDYKITFTVIPSSKEYPPINISIQAPEELARLLLATPIGQVSLAVERAGGTLLDKTPLLDFKP